MINGNKVVKEPGRKDVKFIFKKAFDINKVTVGGSNEPYFIAEAG